MKIIAGGTEIWVNSAYEDNLYQGEVSRPVLRISGLELFTQEQVDALTANPIDVYDNDDHVILQCQGYNAVGGYGLILHKATSAEQQIAALQTELEKIKIMKQNLEKAKSNLERVKGNLEVENASLVAQKAMLESQIAALEAQLAGTGTA